MEGQVRKGPNQCWIAIEDPNFMGSPSVQLYLFTASFNLLPTLNFTVLEAGI